MENNIPNVSLAYAGMKVKLNVIQIVWMALAQHFIMTRDNISSTDGLGLLSPKSIKRLALEYIRQVYVGIVTIDLN